MRKGLPIGQFDRHQTGALSISAGSEDPRRTQIKRPASNSASDEQRTTLPRLARHVAPGGVLLFTCGPDEGEVIGTVEGDPVYHASLSPQEYATLLELQGLAIEAFVPEDPDCDLHTICLARRAKVAR